MHRQPVTHSSLDQVLIELAADFESKLGTVAAANATRQREEIEALRELDAPALWEANRRLTRESRRVLVSHLIRGQELPTTCPEPDVEAARLAVRGGLSIADFLKCYRIGHSCTWNAWLEVIEESGAPLALRTSCMATLSRFVSSYDERLADLVADEYQDESERAKPNAERTRLRLFRDLIEGKTESIDGLDYALDLNHIGVIAWGSKAQRAFDDCAKALDGRSISVPAEHGLVMGWVGLTRPFADAERRVLRELEPLGDAAVALGSPHRKYEGLRRTHREAGDAHVVALRRPAPVTLYDDVALEALALQDERAARDFVESALVGINGDDKRSQQLRATLQAYFAAEQNGAATAAAMGVHQATIPRHLAQIEQRTGRRVNERRAELETALRLRSLLVPGG